MAELTDVDLLSYLQVALSPLPSRPDEQSIARLHDTLAELALETEPVNITTKVHHRNASQHSARVRQHRFTRRSSVVVASAISIALTAGAAAAAVATNTLPGPTRAIAYDLGLPVTSPSLFLAQQASNQLRQSIIAHNGAREKQLGQKLIDALKMLDPNDLSQIRGSADKLLTEIGLGLPTLSNSTTTPTTKSDTNPSSSVPSAKVPSVTVPSVTIPKVTVPTLKLPGAP